MKKNTTTHEKFFHKTYYYNHYSQLWYAESLLANTSLSTDIKEYKFNTLRNTKRLSHLENSNQLRKFIHAERKPYSYIAEINEKRVNEIKKRAHISARLKRVLRIFAQFTFSNNFCNWKRVRHIDFYVASLIVERLSTYIIYIYSYVYIRTFLPKTMPYFLDAITFPTHSWHDLLKHCLIIANIVINFARRLGKL